LKVRATASHPIEWWMTGGRSVIAARAIERLESAILARQVTHDGSFTLTRHVLNARTRPGRGGVQLHKEHPESPRKIDAAIAAVAAYEARAQAVAGRLGQPRQPMGGWTL
jgi:phage terminase large subunit-like protein